MARPTKLTPERERVIVDALRDAAPLATAAALAGISRDTLYEWKRRGEAERGSVDAGNPPDPAEAAFLQFSDAVRRADAECEAALARTWNTAALTDWRAAERLLARRYRDSWGDSAHLRVEEVDPENQPITLTRLAAMMGVEDD